MSRTVTLNLTLEQAEQLLQVVSQGWGDGDHAEYLGDKRKANCCAAAMNKLVNAYIKAGGSWYITDYCPE